MSFWSALVGRSSVVSVALLFGSVLGGSLLGCSPPIVKVELRGFGYGAVDGLWFYRNQGSGYQRVCRYDLSNTFWQGGVELVEYRQSCNDGRPASPAWDAVVKRS